MTSKHSCKGQPDDALIAHPWREHEGIWVRDDCVEQGVAYAAMVSPDGAGRWPGGSAEQAMAASDAWLRQRGWQLIESADVPNDPRTYTPVLQAMVEILCAGSGETFGRALLIACAQERVPVPPSDGLVMRGLLQASFQIIASGRIPGAPDA